ncbi:ribosome recycling factor [Candidatus Profftella armatura (Diaphorina cf. continua)]|uniref:Ribosome-recycling factor n=1 Tax=Candidatus Profftella armatura (Diaphorina cf. continua) TaxID=2661583 RepID=A0A7R6W090_9PROT|nr:ribosome recycling factor [Candidatus Profftella armatura (Diaphorina cf. continua)]BCG49738.1 ribosome recycling factor [Candidatus Profftella armatura (Diaphorina cf. continua)]
MTIIDIIKNTEQKMLNTIKILKENLKKIRTGRANISMLDYIQVKYHENLTKLLKIANVILVNSHTISIQPFEQEMTSIIKKAINEANLGLNPTIQNDVIYISIPPLTKERREEIVKLIKNITEETKISIRKIRRDSNEILKKLLKNKILSIDDEYRNQHNIQKLTDKFILEIDQLLINKEKEILTF